MISPASPSRSLFTICVGRCYGLQKLGVALQVTEAILGHTSGSRAAVVGIYQRHDYSLERKAALEAWGAYVMALVEGKTSGKVLPLVRV